MQTFRVFVREIPDDLKTSTCQTACACFFTFSLGAHMVILKEECIMSRQVSPFASLTGAEKQIKWLEYQSIRLPYVQAEIEKPSSDLKPKQKETTQASPSAHPDKAGTSCERPQPPPEVPRVMPDFQRTRHSQYDAVVARMKQAELQSRVYRASQTSQKTH